MLVFIYFLFNFVVHTLYSKYKWRQSKANRIIRNYIFVKLLLSSKSSLLLTGQNAFLQKWSSGWKWYLLPYFATKQMFAKLLNKWYIRFWAQVSPRSLCNYNLTPQTIHHFICINYSFLLFQNKHEFQWMRMHGGSACGAFF